MAKGKPTTEVRTPAPETVPADPLDAFDAAVAAPEGAEPPAGAQETAGAAQIERLKAENASVTAANEYLKAEADRMRAELAAAQESLTREMREAGERRAEVWELKRKLGGTAETAAAPTPAPGRYAVTCGHLPGTVVEAVDTADAVRKYQEALGVWSLPSVPEVKPHAGPVAADPPEQP